MTPQVIHLHHKTPIKPLPGEACNGCGICCALETCPAARLRFRQIKGPCPALEWSVEASRYRCGLLARPRHYLSWLPAALEPISQTLLSRWIAAGQGCDCDADDPRRAIDARIT